MPWPPSTSTPEIAHLPEGHPDRHADQHVAAPCDTWGQRPTWRAFVRTFVRAFGPALAGLAGLALIGLGLGCGSDSSTTPDPDPPLVFPDPEPYDLERPPGFPIIQIPADNPMTVQGIELGRRLFYDTLLSDNETISCASCHKQQHAFGDNARFSVGTQGFVGDRQAPTIFNLVWIRDFFWDGRARGTGGKGLENQARHPVPNPIEMNLPWDAVVRRLRNHPEYPTLFGRAFGDTAISEDRTVNAIAQFERTILSFDTRFDRFDRGEIEFTAQESLGRELFMTERGDCFHCHPGIMKTDGLFHNIGLEVVPDSGLAAVTGRPSDYGLFKTPSLRNVEFSSPYMHDGRFATLEEVVQHYNRGGVPGLTLDSNVDPLIRINRGLGLTDDEVDALIAFIRTMGDPGLLTNPAFASPFEP